MSNTTQITFEQNGDDAKHVVRPMPLTLRGILTENDFEGFCDKIDLLLLTFHESSAILHSRLKQLLLALLMLFVIFSLLISLPIYNNQLVVIVSSSAALCWLLFANAVCKHKCYENSLQEGIRVECEELTNRTTFATFQLVIKTIKQTDTKWKEISHIDVLISDNESS